MSFHLKLVRITMYVSLLPPIIIGRVVDALRPVAVVAVLDVVDDGADPRRVHLELLQVVQLRDHAGVGAAAVVWINLAFKSNFGRKKNRFLFPRCYAKSVCQQLVDCHPGLPLLWRPPPRGRTRKGKGVPTTKREMSMGKF